MINKLLNKKIFFFSIIFLTVLALTVIIVLTKEDKCRDCAESITLLEYNNAYYELLNDEYLKKINLDNKILKSDLGENLMTIDSTNIDSYDKYKYLGCPVYEYKPVASKGVVVVDKKGKYQLFGFCNFIRGKVKDNVKIDAIKYLEVFNITSSTNIINIEVIDPYSQNLLGNPKTLKVISETDLISKFYSEYRNMRDVGRESYNKTFKEISDEEWQNGYDSYLEGQRNIILNFSNGLSTILNYYPAIHFIEDRMSYYRLDEELMVLLSELCE